MTACPSTTWTALVRTGGLAVVFSTTFGLVLGQSGLALAQDASRSTVRAVLDADGSVSSVQRLGGDQAVPAAGDLPVSLTIAESANGPVTTTNYTVENTTVEKQTLSYVGANGKEATTEQDVALPLVAQLSVRLPASRTDVNAFGARVTRLADGSTELVWSLVLFGPIGAPISEVGFSSTGTGAPVARLEVAAVRPSTTPGLAATGQAANATLSSNGVSNMVATGANDGLLKLSDGVAQLLAGLDKLQAGADKLNAGIVTAVDGAEQLADGSEKAHAGSGDLAAGLDKLAAGNTALAAGAGKLDTGAGKIMAGLDTANTGGAKLAAGGTALAKGAGDAAAGAKALAEGLAQISGGLDKISAAQGLPAALDGAKKLQAGVDQLRAGLGAPATEGTILNGVAKLSGGLVQVKGGIDALATGLPAAQTGAFALSDGLGRAKAGVDASKGGVDQVIAGIDDALRPGGGIDQLAGTLATIKNSVPDSGAVTDAYLTGVIDAIQAVSATDTTTDPATGATVPLVSLREKNMLAAGGLGQVSGGLGQVSPGLGSAVDGALAIGNGLTAAVDGAKKLQAGVGQLQAGTGALNDGLAKVAGGLESGDPTKPGIAEGLDALVNGLTAAVGGVTQLATGAKSAATGSAALADGNAKIAAGATQLAAGNSSLSSGLGQLLTGSQELKAGTAKLSDGGGQLAAGATKAAQGADDLNAGLGKIAAGQRKVADGLPAAADGSGQLADGIGKVVVGQQKVAGGLGDVRSKAISVLRTHLEQGTELATQQLAALDAASTRVAETPGAATTTWVLTQPDGTIQAELASSDSDLARNTAFGVGGALLLMTGIAGGYLSGRRRSIA